MPFEKALRRLIAAGLCGFLALGALKWIVYRGYVRHDCANRPLQLHWKDAAFCADRRDVSVWSTIDVLIATSLALVMISLVVAYAMSIAAKRRT